MRRCKKDVRYFIQMYAFRRGACLLRGFIMSLVPPRRSDLWCIPAPPSAVLSRVFSGGGCLAEYRPPCNLAVSEVVDTVVVPAGTVYEYAYDSRRCRPTV